MNSSLCSHFDWILFLILEYTFYGHQLDTVPTMLLSIWPYPWLCPWRCKVNVWNSTISGMEWPIDMERKRCQWIIHEHGIDLCVAMVGWVDASDSDRMTSNVGVSSTHLVMFLWIFCCLIYATQHHLMVSSPAIAASSSIWNAYHLC